MKVGDKVVVHNLFSGNRIEGEVVKVEPHMFDVRTGSKNKMLKTIYFDSNMRGLGRFSMWMVEGIKKH